MVAWQHSHVQKASEHEISLPIKGEVACLQQNYGKKNENTLNKNTMPGKSFFFLQMNPKTEKKKFEIVA